MAETSGSGNSGLTEALSTLEKMPERISRLPIDKRGYPVPWFVAWIDGEPDFRVMDGEKLRDAIQFRRCWVCGDFLGANVAFVVGPMCAVNRTSAEPPSHRECASWSARNCPFLTEPRMKRREKHLPDAAVDPAGLFLRRNPGVALVWVTRSYGLFGDGHGGVLVKMGDPVETEWWAEGRAATREEVLASFDSGLPALKEVASEEGRQAVKQLEAMHATALELVPA